MAMQYPEWIWHNGAIKRWAEATTHVMAHVVHYGSSVFEGIRSYQTPNGPVIFRLTDHNKRLYRLGQDLRHGDPVLAGADQRRLPRRDQGQRQHHRLPAPGRLPRPRRLRPVGGYAGRSRGRHLEDGPVPRRQRGRTGHRRLRVELAALRAEYAARPAPRPAATTCPASWSRARRGAWVSAKASHWPRPACSAKARARTCSWCSTARCTPRR